MSNLSEKLIEVKAKIAAAAARAGRNPDDVEIIAVTKTHGADVISEAKNAGLRIVGENKVQEAMRKKWGAVGGMEWHLIGHLQTNKVRAALGVFDFIHSVDSEKLIERINILSAESGKEPHILLEVNVAGESSKTGMKVEELDGAIKMIMERAPRITLEGLMTMAPFSPNPEDARPYFRRLRELRDSAEKRFGITLPRLSMGMSGDYEVAVEEGATWVRLGTILFGDRKKDKWEERCARREKRLKEGFSGLDSYSGEGPTCRILD